MQTVLDFVASVPGLRFDLLAKLLLAAVLGAAVGWEREQAGKPAGLRTNILICLGATLLTDVGMALSADRGDPARMSAQIVSGIGFLGAGTIIQSRGKVSGLTTAATLWVVAAVGIALGTGQYGAAVLTTLVVLLVLYPLRRLAEKAEGGQEADGAGEASAD
ncbi:MAG: MgtC/SapB family protein [Longimicrobiales bacterium]